MQWYFFDFGGNMSVKYCQKCDNIYEMDVVYCTVDGTVLIQDNLLQNVIIGGKRRYVVLKKIGFGGMGAVYKARDTLLNRDCAIKMTHFLLTANTAVQQRFIREAHILAKLQSPTIVTTYDMETENNSHFIVMEYVTGTTLNTLIREKKLFPIVEALPIIAEIGQALTEAHQKDIIHRDLKPANIMVYKDAKNHQHVKVLDFGIAKLISSQYGMWESTTQQFTPLPLTNTGTILGTPQYMSPEQVEGLDNIDVRSDIYSFALIIYEMLSGSLPFIGNNPQEIMIKRLLKDPIPIRQINPELPETVEQIIMKGLAKKPDERIASAEELFSLLIGSLNNVEMEKGSFANQETGTPLTMPISSPYVSSVETTKLFQWKPIKWNETEDEK